MENTNFKVGDWGFCEFKLQQITRIEDGNIRGVTDGMFEMGSSNLNDEFFPLEMKTKQISDAVEYWHDRFHKECRKLNFPAISGKLRQMWIEMVLIKDDDKELKEAYKRLDTFGRTIIEKSQDLKHDEVDGVRIFA